VKVRLDSPGILEMLQSEDVALAVEELAETVASSIDETARNGDPIPVRTGSFTSDRAGASVTLAHPAGIGLEAKYGTLSTAARAAGLDVKLWGGE
jgi:hypothetical protein